LRANRLSFRSAWEQGHLPTLMLKIGFLAGNAVLFAAAASGVWFSRKRLVTLAPLWSFPLFLLTAHLPMYVEPRYGLPIVPFVIMFASVALDSMFSLVKPLDGLRQFAT
jgi:hypothetical protein